MSLLQAVLLASGFVGGGLAYEAGYRWWHRRKQRERELAWIKDIELIRATHASHCLLRGSPFEACTCFGDEALGKSEWLG